VNVPLGSEAVLRPLPVSRHWRTHKEKPAITRRARGTNKGPRSGWKRRRDALTITRGHDGKAMADPPTGALAEMPVDDPRAPPMRGSPIGHCFVWALTSSRAWVPCGPCQIDCVSPAPAAAPVHAATKWRWRYGIAGPGVSGFGCSYDQLGGDPGLERPPASLRGSFAAAPSEPAAAAITGGSRRLVCGCQTEEAILIAGRRRRRLVGRDQGCGQRSVSLEYGFMPGTISFA
jgi:hypothetical protein